MKYVMLAAIFVLGISFSFAQGDPSVGAPGCGPEKQTIEVIKTKKYSSIQPDPGKALLYVVQDDTHFETRPRPTTRIGLDGIWVGATQGSAFFRALVDPGEHHICASWQGSFGLIEVGTRVAALHFTVEPGKSYYFRVRNRFIRERGPADLDFAPVDSDEGQLLANKAALSSIRSK